MTTPSTPITTSLPKCHDCGAKCCKYLCLELSPQPDHPDSFDHLRWIMLRNNVRLLVELPDSPEDLPTWSVLFISDCSMLDPLSHRCRIYETRPQICRDYSPEPVCDKDGGGLQIRSVEELEKYWNEVWLPAFERGCRNREQWANETKTFLKGP